MIKLKLKWMDLCPHITVKLKVDRLVHIMIKLKELKLMCPHRLVSWCRTNWQWRQLVWMMKGMENPVVTSSWSTVTMCHVFLQYEKHCIVISCQYQLEQFCIRCLIKSDSPRLIYILVNDSHCYGLIQLFRRCKCSEPLWFKHYFIHKSRTKYYTIITKQDLRIS